MFRKLLEMLAFHKLKRLEKEEYWWLREKDKSDSETYQDYCENQIQILKQKQTELISKIPSKKSKKYE